MVGSVSLILNRTQVNKKSGNQNELPLIYIVLGFYWTTVTTPQYLVPFSKSTL